MSKNAYSDIIQSLKEPHPRDEHFARRVNELISTNELLRTLNTARTLEESLHIVLLTILGEYPCSKGAIFIKEKASWRLGISRGLRNRTFDFSQFPAAAGWDCLPRLVRRDDAGLDPPFAALFFGKTFHLVIPIHNEKQLVGLICLGKSIMGYPDTAKIRHLETIAGFSGVVIGNHLNRVRLELSIIQLRTLKEITEAFARCYEEEAVYQTLANTLMGQFFISRCAVLQYGEQAAVSFKKGVRIDLDPELAKSCLPLSEWQKKVYKKSEVLCESVASFMGAAKLSYVCPIYTEENTLGLLLLGSRLDRKILSPEDLDFISPITQQAAAAIENVHLQREVVEKKRLEKELQLARDIQQRLLPKTLPCLPEYEISVEMRPFDQVGGDFYDFIPLDDGRIGVCLADVSGKSLPASMIMSTAQASLRALNSFPGLKPDEIIEKLNLHLYQSTQSNKYVTMFYAILDPVRNLLTYINAGHNRPILVKPDLSVSLLTEGGMVVGLFPGAKYQIGQVPFDEGSDLLIYTDGLSEVMDCNGEEFGDDRLIESVGQLKDCPSVDAAKASLISKIMNFCSGQMVDDLTLLLIRRRKMHEEGKGQNLNH